MDLRDTETSHNWFINQGQDQRIRQTYKETSVEITESKNREHVVTKCCSSHEVTTYSSKHEITAHVGS